MKKLFKKNLKILIAFFCGILVTCGIVYATGTNANDITYKNGTVKDALDDLYSAPTVKKFCELKNETYGQKGQVGSMYECDPGDGVKRNFYILAINNDNSVDMIMQHNITEGTATTTMTWNNAMKYIDNNNLKTTWSNVLDVDLPKAQDIANAVGRSDWYAADNSSWWCLETKKQDTTSSPYCYNTTLNTLWLWDYTRDCSSWNCEHSLGSTEAYGYWTRDLISGGSNARPIYGHGTMDYGSISTSSKHGVRPVITVLKSNLYEQSA